MTNFATATAENTGVNCHKPWKLDPDLTGKSETVRDTPAIMGGTATTHDDIVNNLEQVVIPSPVTGDYTVRIMVKGPVGQPNTPVDAASTPADQWVSVILTGVKAPYVVDFNLIGINPGENAPGTYAITIETVAGGIYRMQRSNNLSTWTDADNINISARTNTVQIVETTPAGWTRIFWRCWLTY